LTDYVQEINAILAGWTPSQGSKNNQKGAEAFKEKLAVALKDPAPNLISIQPYIESVDPVEFYTTELKRR